MPKPLPEVPEALVPFVEALARLLAESFLREIEGRKPPILNETAWHGLLTVKQFAKKHPAFIEAALRSFIFQAGSVVKPNGFEVAVCRLGRRVLIDEKKFFEWIAAQQ